MAETSTNLGLTLPALSERLSLTVLNQNWNLIDAFAGKVLPQSGQELTDLDEVTTQGVYSYDKLTSAMTHAPNTGTYFSGTLFVDYYNAGKVTQMFIQSAGRVFTRHKWNGTWGDWVELLTQNTTGSFSDKSTWLATAEQGSGAVVLFSQIGKNAFLDFRTTGRVHSENDLLLTLPSGYRPASSIDVPAYINGGMGVVRINSNGQVTVLVLSSSYTTNARVYAYASYPLA